MYATPAPASAGPENLLEPGPGVVRFGYDDVVMDLTDAPEMKLPPLAEGESKKKQAKVRQLMEWPAEV